MLNYTVLEHVKPEEVNVDSQAILDFLTEITEKKLGLHSFTVVRHDKICAQGFFAPYSAEYPHVLYSMSKSLTSTAVGFAVDEGLIRLDDRVVDFFPECRTLRRAFNRAITVRMLLTMKSDKLVTVFEEKGNTDWVQLFFDAPFMLPPNSKFNYISENTFMLSAIVSRVTGKSVVDYLDEKMFRPLGIEKPFWEADGKGNSAGGWGCYMKSEDLAKFFLPYIHGGKWIDGTQLIPEHWVREALSKQTDSVHDGAMDIINGYGYQFWKNRIANSFRADGLFGQRCFMFPDFDGLVILNCGEAEDYKIMDVFWKYFPNCFKSEELSENKKVSNKLDKKIASLAMPKLRATQRDSELEKKIDGRSIACKTNEYTSVVTVTTTQMLFNKPGNLNLMKFSFKENSLLFTWREKDYVNTIEAGLNGEMRESEIHLADLNYHAFSQAAWQKDGSLVLWIRPVESAHERRFTFRFDDMGVSVDNQSVPTFPDLTVYYLNFSGNPLKTAAGERGLRRTVENLGLPLVEPNFRGLFID